MGSAISPTDYANATETMVNGVLVTRTSQRIAIGDVEPVIAKAFLAEPIDGYYDLICHGWKIGTHVAPSVDGRYAHMTAEELAFIILAQPDYDGQPIRLVACWTGRYENGFAAQLSSTLGARKVLACSNRLKVLPNGTLVPLENGIWRLFVNAQVIDQPAEL